MGRRGQGGFDDGLKDEVELRGQVSPQLDPPRRGHRDRRTSRPGHVPGDAMGGPASTASLLGKSWRAPLPFSSFPWLPACLPFPPVPLVGFFAPLTPVMGLPPWRRLPTPSCPRRRGRRIVAHGDLEDGRRHVHGFDDAPGTVPGRPDIPSTIGKHPVLMRVEKDVRRGPGRIVDRRSGNDHERRRIRELNADVHPDSYLRSNRYRDGCHEQRTERPSRTRQWDRSGPRALAPPNSQSDYGTVIVVPSPLAVMENVPVLLDV